MARWSQLLIALVCLCGCADMGKPRLFHPGSVEDQRRRFETFDPYPLPGIGPDVAGGRPMQFDRPAPENERVQNNASFMEKYRQPPPPGIFRGERTSSPRQQIIYTPAPLVTPTPGAPYALPPSQYAPPPAWQ